MPTSKSRLAGLLEIFFKFLYHQFSWGYDFVAYIVSVGLWKDWIRAILPKIKGSKILEIGHGPGHLQVELFTDSKEIFGLDLSPQMGRMAFRKIEKSGNKPKLINGNTDTLPFPPNSFNTIAATFPTNYIKSPKVIGEIYRALKTGGEFVFIPVASLTGKSFIYNLATILFKITGQSSRIDKTSFSELISEYQRIGFAVKTEILELRNSQVLLFHCQK
jgi:ubiquinone/menaquinone biosynthesis C-methylase UbiE